MEGVVSQALVQMLKPHLHHLGVDFLLEDSQALVRMQVLQVIHLASVGNQY